MANETMQNLANLSKKSVQQVESTYNSLMDSMKKTNSTYKSYQIEKNPNTKSKKYATFMGEFMVQLKQKLGINKDVQVESVLRESEEIVNVWADFEWKDRSGKVDEEMSIGQKNDFEEAFGGEFGEVPEEIDNDGYNVAYQITRTQYEWCVSNYSDNFTLEPEAVIEEDGEVGSVNTSSMGSPTTANGSPAPFGNSAIYADKIGFTSRKGDFKVSKRKIRESVEYLNKIMKDF
jgi:hypothetical protein